MTPAQHIVEPGGKPLIETHEIVGGGSIRKTSNVTALFVGKVDEIRSVGTHLRDHQVPQ
jgi:hypothetical protein